MEWRSRVIQKGKGKRRGGRERRVEELSGRGGEEICRKTERGRRIRRIKMVAVLKF